MSGFDAIAAYNGDCAVDLAGQTPYIAIQAICPCTILLISGNERTANLLADAVRDGHEFDILAKPVHPSVILDRLRNGSHRTHPDEVGLKIENRFLLATTAMQATRKLHVGSCSLRHQTNEIEEGFQYGSISL